jgi:hypothetical protein
MIGVERGIRGYFFYGRKICLVVAFRVGLVDREGYNFSDFVSYRNVG